MLKLRNILFARDFSPSSDEALKFALRLAEASGARLHVLFAAVLNSDPFAPPERPAQPVDLLRERMTLRFTEAKATMSYDPGSIPVEHVVVRGVAAAPALLEYAQEHDVDLIVMGTHGRRGLRRFLMGSVAEEVVRCAPCPVLTVRQPHEAASDEDAESDAESLLVPVDFSDHAQLALQHAKGLSRLLKRPIELLHVVEETLHPAFYGPALKTLDAQGPEMDQRILEALQTLDEQTGPAFGTTSYLVRYGHPARDIIQVAEEGRYGLVVMGTHGLTGMERFFMGSVAEKVLRRVPCPVFTIKSFGRSLVPTTEDEQTHLTSM